MQVAPASSTKKWWLIGLGGLGAVSVVAMFRKASPVSRLTRFVEPVIETRLHVANKKGIVEADPKGLAHVAGVPLDQYVLASCMQSEEKTDKARLAIGCAVMNAVKWDRRKLVKKLIPHGYLGSQHLNHYADTKKPPTARTLALAGAILAGRVPDMVKGAVQWDAPLAQDSNYRKYLREPEKYPQYSHDSTMVAENRERGGARKVLVPGVPETRFWSYRKA